MLPQRTGDRSMGPDRCRAAIGLTLYVSQEWRRAVGWDVVAVLGPFLLPGWGCTGDKCIFLLVRCVHFAWSFQFSCPLIVYPFIQQMLVWDQASCQVLSQCTKPATHPSHEACLPGGETASINKKRAYELVAVIQRQTQWRGTGCWWGYGFRWALLGWHLLGLPMEPSRGKGRWEHRAYEISSCQPSRSY